jgi:hypothetical protein
VAGQESMDSAATNSEGPAAKPSEHALRLVKVETMLETVLSSLTALNKSNEPRSQEAKRLLKEQASRLTTEQAPGITGLLP